MSAAIETLDPKPVWKLFAGISATPRPSKKEQRIRAFLKETASGMGFKVDEDTTGNLLISIPATSGHEGAPITVLQGHMDMVCEKNSDSRHDFENDPIKLILDKDKKGQQIVRAEGTTLGADNGLGVALALAAASEKDVVHGPLEILVTVDEEQGMTGAKALKTGFLKGKQMINLDSEEDDMIYIGCAGGSDVNLEWVLPTTGVLPEAEVCLVEVRGLVGGHSGCDIHLNRANANKLLATVLTQADPLRIAEISGGSLRNAIPREARATVVGHSGLCDSLQRAADAVRTIARKDHREDQCQITVTRGSAHRAMGSEDSIRLLSVLTAVPHGVLAVVPDIAGLIQTSNSMSVVETVTTDSQAHIKISCLARSSLASELDNAVGQIMSIGRLAGAQTSAGNQYPGWAPNADSRLLEVCKRTYEKLFKQNAAVTAIHAGLECGIINERMGGDMDLISFGPTITGPHSPDEKTYVASVQKIWEYLKAVLKELS